MAYSSQSYGVQYDMPTKDAWLSGFYQLTWYQSCTSSRGFAIHTFQGSGTVNDIRIMGSIMGDISGLADSVRPISFNVIGQDGKTGPKQYHCITKVEIHSNPKPIGGFRIMVRSEPMLVLMDKERKNRALVGQKISDVVKQVVASTTQVTLGKVEDTINIPEFGVVRQLNLTDLQFIIHYLAPRAFNGKNGGYELWTDNGKNVMFTTINYGLTKPFSFKPDPERYISAEECDQSFDVNQQGGMVLSVLGFDHYRKGAKEVSVKLGADFSPSCGSEPNLFSSGLERFEYAPFQSQLAISALAGDRHDRLRQTAAEFTIKLSGSAEGVPIPCGIDLSNMNYRGQSTQQGVVSGVLNTIRKGKLVHEVRVRRDKWNIDKS